MPVSVHAAGIAVISHAGISPYRVAIEGFRAQAGLPLREYYLGAKNEHLDDVKDAIGQQQPELIFALGKSALSLAREINQNVPVIFVFVLHPEQGLERRGRHREAGVSMSIAAIEQFNTLLEIAPGITRIGVVYDPSKSAGLIQQAKRAADMLGLTLVVKTASNQKEAARAIADVFGQVGAMWMIPDTTVLTSTTTRQMTRLSLKYSVALIGLAAKYVRAGSLFSLSFDSRAIGQQAGRMAAAMLQGRKQPALLSPDISTLVLNRQTADRLGLQIPARFLQKAKHVYPEKYGEKH